MYYSSSSKIVFDCIKLAGIGLMTLKKGFVLIFLFIIMYSSVKFVKLGCNSYDFVET